jgi:hypothetical protein
MKTKEATTIYQIQQRISHDPVTGFAEWPTIRDHYEATIQRAVAEIAIRKASGNTLAMRWKPLRVVANLQSHVSTKAQGSIDSRFIR